MNKDMLLRELFLRLRLPVLDEFVYDPSIFLLMIFTTVFLIKHEQILYLQGALAFRSHLYIKRARYNRNIIIKNVIKNYL